MIFVYVREETLFISERLLAGKAPDTQFKTMEGVEVFRRRYYPNHAIETKRQGKDRARRGQRGRKQTPEHIRKRALTVMGSKNGRWHVPVLPESRRKMSQIRLEREHSKGINNPNYGRHLSPEKCRARGRKISAARKGLIPAVNVKGERIWRRIAQGLPPGFMWVRGQYHVPVSPLETPV